MPRKQVAVLKVQKKATKSAQSSDRSLSISRKISSMYQSRYISSVNENEQGMKLSSNARQIVHECIQTELFKRIDLDLLSLAASLVPARRALSDLKSAETKPILLALNRVQFLGQRISHIVNPILQMIQKDGSEKGGETDEGLQLTRPETSVHVQTMKLHRAFYSAGILLETLEQMSFILQDDLEVSRFFELISRERKALHEALTSLYIALKSFDPKWRWEAQLTDKVLVRVA